MHLNPSGAGTFSRGQVTHCTEWESSSSFILDSQGAVTYMRFGMSLMQPEELISTYDAAWLDAAWLDAA